MIIVFDNEQLLPSAWRESVVHGSVRMFNPGLLRCGDGWLLAYRVVSEPGLRRRIAFCRLDAAFRVVAGSHVPFTDLLAFGDARELAPEATTWFADPRLYQLQGRPFLYWNSGWHEPRNYQFLQELDPATLAPIGSPRELRLADRQKLEKNWTLFERDGLYAIYSVHPHRVLRFSLAGDGPIEFTDAAPRIPNPGGHAQLHGGLRGGTPPQLFDGHFYSFCHSIETDTGGYRYEASAYRFSAEFPFAPTDMPSRPLRFAVPERARRVLPKLNPAVSDVIYPAGAAYAGGRWVVSFGIDDERCALALLSSTEVITTLSPVPPVLTQT